MLGLLFIITVTALLSSGDAFSLGSSQRLGPLGPPVDRLFQPHFIQEIVRTKRHSVQELVRAQPHLVHDMGRPEIHETSRSQAKVDAANSSQLQEVARTRPAVEENLGVEDEMERMVHLVVPQELGSYRGRPDSTNPERELLAGPGAGDASLEASGFYGTDMEDRDRGEEGGEDRDRGEEGGEDRDRRGGEGEWERDMVEDKERRGGEDRGKEEERRGGTDDAIHTSPDLDALIGYTSPVRPSRPSPPTEGQDSGLQEQRSSLVLEAGPLERDLWEADGHSSGYGGLHSSITTASTTTTTTTTSTPTTTTTAGGGDPAGTDPPETDTGTDFGLLGSYTKEDEETERDEEDEEDEEDTGLAHREVFTQNPTVAEGGVAPSREPMQPSVEEEEELEEEEHRFKGVRPHDSEEEDRWRKMEEEEEGTRTSHIVPLTTGPAPTVGFTNPSWDWLEKTTSLQTPRSEVRGGGVTEENRQVMCVDWSKLSERGYVLLNTTDNLNCEEFRVDHGVRLLKVIERVFARRMNSPEGSWEVYLSKPTHQQHQLMMNVVSEHGVISTKELLGMLGEIRRMLTQLGVQNYSSPSSCQSRPSQTRSDYGKLFVVLVIIGSVCLVIITSGFIYICWQRRPPATKTTFRAEELHFVENSCHDNPTLDITNDSQPEMSEKKKKPSTNGLAGGGEGGGAESSRWQVFVNQAATEEEEEEQDTHL